MAHRVNPIQSFRHFAGMLLAALLMLPACVSVSGCADPVPTTAPTHVKVTIDGKTYNLELALDEPTRNKGLGGRTEVAPDGGMLFSFKTSDLRSFVMRDCFTPIDIIFLDGTGRVTQTHMMPIEPPRGEGEGEIGDYQNRAYALRLTRYSSRFSAKYVIELAGNTLDEIEVNETDLIEFDTDLLDRFTK